jgi:hypothetical protein
MSTRTLNTAMAVLSICWSAPIASCAESLKVASYARIDGKVYQSSCPVNELVSVWRSSKQKIPVSIEEATAIAMAEIRRHSTKKKNLSLMSVFLFKVSPGGDIWFYSVAINDFEIGGLPMEVIVTMQGRAVPLELVKR